MATEKKEVCDVTQTIENKGWIKNLLWGGLAIIAITIIINSFGGGGSGLSGYSKTFELEVVTLEPHKLCGVPSGKHTFTIPFQRHVKIMGDDYDVTSYIRVNKSLPNEVFEVASDGCVEVSFAFNSLAKGLSIQPQIIAITFK